MRDLNSLDRVPPAAAHLGLNGALLACAITIVDVLAQPALAQEWWFEAGTSTARAVASGLTTVGLVAASRSWQVPRLERAAVAFFLVMVGVLLQSVPLGLPIAVLVCAWYLFGGVRWRLQPMVAWGVCAVPLVAVLAHLGVLSAPGAGRVFDPRWPGGLILAVGGLLLALYVFVFGVAVWYARVQIAVGNKHSHTLGQVGRLNLVIALCLPPAVVVRLLLPGFTAGWVGTLMLAAGSIVLHALLAVLFWQRCLHLTADARRGGAAAP